MLCAFVITTTSTLVNFLKPNKSPQRSSVYLSISWSFQTPKCFYYLTQNFLSSQIPASKHKINKPLLKLAHVSVFRVIWFRSKRISSLTAKFWYIFTPMPVAWTLNLSSPWAQYQMLSRFCMWVFILHSFLLSAYRRSIGMTAYLDPTAAVNLWHL